MAAFIGATVHAKAPQPSKEDKQHVANIVKRQPRIQELKKYRDELEDLKAKNAADVKAINPAWTLDWATMINTTAETGSAPRKL